MQCPPEIADILHEILRVGLLRIRAFGFAGDSGRCAIEADHLHNLPALLGDFRPESLDYYLNVERVCYSDQSDPDDVACFDSLWNSLATRAMPVKKQAG
jgi:hypothetical protein